MNSADDNDEDNGPITADAVHGKLPSTGKKRSRKGCLNCRRKRRKCSETKPTCKGCHARKEVCEWGLKVSFRPENAQTVGRDEHRSLARRESAAGRSFQIIDMTSEIARDYVTDTTPAQGSKEGNAHQMPGTEQDGEEQRSQETTGNTRDPVPDLPSSHSVDSAEGFGVFTMEHGSAPHSTRDDNAGPTRASTTTRSTPHSHGSMAARSGTEFLASPSLNDSFSEDGIFLPGSQYQELHAEFRSLLFDTAQAALPNGDDDTDMDGLDSFVSADPITNASIIDEESRNLAQLTPEQEFTLWQNFITEVAPWIDKFDINRHFELVLPMLAREAEHLKFSILALSARQIELKERKPELSCSLALYQHAIHLLSPLLQRRTTVVLASSVVLCVLEMLSCAPKAWRRHLDGCAALIQALGITGTSGGIEQAIFWCFARMDVAGGLISLEKTLIPISKWVGGLSVSEDMALLSSHASFAMCANSAVYLCGRVIHLLCYFGRWEQRYSEAGAKYTNRQYVTQWLELFELIESWYRDRPQEMRAILTIPANQRDPPRPFPMVLFPNAPAIAGNQMYHTAALLMLKHKPASLHLGQKPRSMLWHARQICAISISNGNHACWTNSTQPIWIAGQLMSHTSEHKAILDLYERIERDTGWATKWRANDLLEHWGDLET